MRQVLCPVVMASGVADYLICADVCLIFVVDKTGKLLRKALIDAVVVEIPPVYGLIADAVGYEKAGGRDTIGLHDRNGLCYV